MRKVGLFITTLLHDITQAGYEVDFCKDFHGMMRVEFYKEIDHGPEQFYEHTHCGFPDCTREQLEKSIIQALIDFKTKFLVPDVTDHGDEDAQT